jgi:ketosteroid isomerase-like protein
MDIERAFTDLINDLRSEVAFPTYAPENEVLNQSNNLIKGKETFEEYYENFKYLHVLPEWKPEFTDISSSGDVAYTYGRYLFEATDDSGQFIEDSGIFHTVLKKNPTGISDMYVINVRIFFWYAFD